MVSIAKRRMTFVAATLCSAVILSVIAGPLPAQAAAPARVPYQEDTPVQPASAEDSAGADASPRGCINPLMAGHIAATLVSLLPLPGYADAADAAAYALNIALKHCPPDLSPPPPIEVPKPSAGCVHRLRLPVPVKFTDLVAMDKAIIEELLKDSAVVLTPSQRSELEIELESEYGRFENIAYGNYSNVYGISLPIRLTAYSVPYWGDIGAPSVFHYNSDALIEMTFPGKRISADLVEVPVGNHQVTWKADTLISEFDRIPFFLASSAMRYYKAAQAKAQKRLAIDASNEVLQKQIQQMLKEGNLFFAKQVAKEIGTNALKKGAFATRKIVAKSSSYQTAGKFTGANTVVFQRLTIVDGKPPVINGAGPVTVEAFDPGGLQSGRKIAELMASIQVTDDCDPDPTLTYTTQRFWPLVVDNNGNPLPSSEIVWRASDNGAASVAGGVNTAEVKQQITVVDTLPPILVAPPPVMMYAGASETVEVPLGSPQVFDVVDLRPDIQYSAPGSTPGVQWPKFGRGVHYVTWTATDQSRNQSEAQRQLVNIKAPGTNNVPTANPLTGQNTVQAVADTPVKITVTGSDPDVDGSGMRDPIWFRVDQSPMNGFFIAPLYPYFIDDYRMTARYSPWIAQRDGEAKAWEVAQDPSKMLDYIKGLCAEDFNRTDLPKDFISFLGGDQKYMAVDDDGYTYIYDQAYRKCSPGGSTIAPTTSPRISVWDQQGRYVGEQERSSSSGRPLRNIKFNVGRGTILTTSSDGSSTGNSLVNISTIQPQNTNEPIVDVRSYGLWNKVNSIYIPSEDVTRTPEYKNAGAAAFDNTTGVLYVIGDRNQNIKGMSAFMPAPCNSGGGSGPEDCLDYIGSQVFSYDIVQSTKWGDFPGLDTDAMKLERLGDITLDSKGNVYVVVNVASGYRYDRIYKFAPAVKHPDGSITLGELIGWSGKCDSGPNCNYIEQRSIGFSCTDNTCTVEGDTYGSRPGQFHWIGAIAVDPNDVLYVADTANQRVQRFTPEGLFAGEARSQSTCPGCSGFVLGDFGSPDNIAVNSNNFYILDKSTELVHVFETSVIHSIDDKSAWVEYQSDTNYVGPDSFTFRATDGFHNAGDLIESAPARVDINVSRNFRPPIAEDGWATTPEEAQVALTLKGYDLDGSLDTLTYKVTFPPQYGTLSGSAPNLTYTPGKDFAGEDALQFTVSDGKFTSDAATYTIVVTPLNDTPDVAPQSNSLQAGLGHPVTLSAAVLDPDEGDELAAVVDWGDGTKETSGDLSQTGGTQGPSLTPLVAGRADLVAYHTYRSAGSYTIRIEATDKAGANGSAQVQVTVGPMADLALKRTAQPVAPVGQNRVSYELTVRNQRSPHGDGIAADGVSVSEIVTGSAGFAGASSSAGDCQVQGKSFTCKLGRLDPDQEAKVTVQLDVGGGAAPGTVIALDAGASSSTPDPIPENNRDRFDLSVVAAGDFYVNSFRDGADAAPGDGVCATAQGECTARASIMEANALGGSQTIVFGSGVFVLEIEAEVASGSADNAAAGDLDIDGDVTLIGIGAQNTALHANAIDRVLEIHGGSVHIVDMTITGGDAGGAEGGGIRNGNGNLRLTRVTVDGNTAVNGGGIMNAGGQLHIVQSSVVQNTAQGSGGGIMNQATLRLENATVSGNQAAGGGGIASAGGNAQLLYVTIAGNSADNAGGGINSTGNSVRIENSLMAGNDAPIGPDCAPELASGGHNLIGDLRNCTLSGSTNDVTGQPPKIDSLTVNAAQTYSHPLLQGSPAIGRATCVSTTDQGGSDRPEQGCDIGAVEAGAFPASNQVLLPVIQRQ